jgi:hypothetical protein
MKAVNRKSKRLFALAGLVAMALFFAGVASADKPKYGFNAADQAAARAAVIKRADLGTASGWTGGAKKPDLSQMQCSLYNPKQSDLVVTGAAESDWSHSPGLEFDSQTEVLQTTRMVALDWKRSVATRYLVPCMKESGAKELGASIKLVSLRRVSFPHVAPHTSALRMILDVKASKTQTIRMVSEMVFMARSRTEITLMSFTLPAAFGSVRAAEVRLARILVGRVAA